MLRSSALNHRRWSIAILLAAASLLAACTVTRDVTGDKTTNVEIKTPVGGVNINTAPAAQETGLAVYPGATPKPKESGDDSNANVNISSSMFGMKIAVAKYLSNDPPEKVMEFYRKQLSQFGRILQCQSSGKGGSVRLGGKSGSGGDESSDDQLTCTEKSGDTIELKVGTKQNQHLVAISRHGAGTEFALVYVNMHSKGEAL